MALSITSLISFYKDDKKSVDRGENHYKSGHVQQCSLDEGVLTGVVRARAYTLFQAEHRGKEI